MTTEPDEAVEADTGFGHRLRARDFEDSYGIALALLICVMILPVFLPAGNVSEAGVAGVACAAALIALHSSRVRPWLFRTALLATVVVIVSLAIDDLNPNDQVRAGYYLGVGFLLFLTPISILIRIAHHRVITPRTLFGVLCVYLLIGISFSFLYQSMDHFSPASFSQLTDADRVSFSYFSFITMTTVGYGDITPTSDATRMLAVSEAVMGQVFLVVVVARVVSMLGHERTPVSREVLRRFHQTEDGDADGDLEDGDPAAIEESLAVIADARERAPDAEPPPPGGSGGSD